MKISSYRKYKGDNGVCVIGYKPVTWKGKCYSKLSPKSQLMLDYKKGKVTEEEYERRYREETLSKLDAKQVYEDLKDNVILTATEEGFCFKRIIAKWIEEEVGVKVEEI